jgi:hypothetical protein
MVAPVFVVNPALLGETFKQDIGVDYGQHGVIIAPYMVSDKRVLLTRR